MAQNDENKPNLYEFLLATAVFGAGFGSAVLVGKIKRNPQSSSNDEGFGINRAAIVPPAGTTGNARGRFLQTSSSNLTAPMKDYIRPLEMANTSKDKSCSDNVVASDNSRYDTFHRLPFCVPVANPVATEVIWTPAVNAPPHRIVLSLPGSPPQNWVLPDNSGKLSVAFVPPHNPDRTEDAGELWFECQPLPASANLDTYVFQTIDYTEWTATTPTVKLICNGVGVLKLVAHLDKPYIITFLKLSDLQRAEVCVKCNITVLGGGIAGAPGGPEGVAAGMAGAAIGSEDCRNCAKERMEDIARAAEAAAAVAREAIERQRHEQEAREARERFEEMDRNNKACEDYDRWSHIA